MTTSYEALSILACHCNTLPSSTFGLDFHSSVFWAWGSFFSGQSRIKWPYWPQLKHAPVSLYHMVPPCLLSHMQVDCLHDWINQIDIKWTSSYGVRCLLWCRSLVLRGISKPLQLCFPWRMVTSEQTCKGQQTRTPGENIYYCCLMSDLNFIRHTQQNDVWP